VILTNCREMAARGTRGEFDDASWFTRLLVRAHLLMCRHCRRFKAQMELISAEARQRADDLLEPARLADFKRKLVRHLGGEPPPRNAEVPVGRRLLRRDGAVTFVPLETLTS